MSVAVFKGTEQNNKVYTNMSQARLVTRMFRKYFPTFVWLTDIAKQQEH
jgi:hypothetical protein